MMSARIAMALAMIMTAVTLPARAEFISDQSRISISSTKVPGLDRMSWMSSKLNGLRY